MTTFATLPLALSLLLGGDHAALHPADATVYVAVPDVPAARAAYEHSAIVQLLRDPEWNRFAAEQEDEDPEAFRLDARTCTWLEDELLVPILGASSREHADAVTDGLRSFSVSVHVPSGATDDVEAEDEFGAVLVIDHDRLAGARACVALVADALGLEAEAVQHKQRPITLFGQEGLVQRWTAPESSTWSATWSAVCGTSAVVGVGAMTPERWLALADAPTHRLSAHERFVQGDALAPEWKELTTFTDVYLDVDDLTGLVHTLESTDSGLLVVALRPVLLEFVQGNALRGRWRTWMDGEGVFRTASRTDLGSGPSAFGARPVPREALERLPAETMYAWAAGADFHALEERVVGVLAGLLGTDAEGARAFLADEAEVDLREDLLAPLGDHVSAFVQPFGGPALPECGLVLDLDDRDAFVAAMDALTEVVGARAGDDLEVITRPYRRQPTYAFFSPVSVQQLLGPRLGMVSMGFGSLRPGFAVGVLEDRVVLTLDRRHLTREVKRVLASRSERDADPAPERNPLATVELPEGATSVSSADWPAALGSLHATLSTLADLGALAFGESAPALPEADALTRHFRPSLSWSRTTGTAAESRCESPLGPELAVGLAWLALQLAPTARPVPGQTTEPAEPVAPGGGAGGRFTDGEETPDERTELAAGTLVVALSEHQASTGALPERLARLTEPGPGGLGPSLETLPRDGWGNAFRYARDADGTGYRLWSTGPNGVDEDGRGDDRRFR